MIIILNLTFIYTLTNVLYYSKPILTSPFYLRLCPFFPVFIDLSSVLSAAIAFLSFFAACLKKHFSQSSSPFSTLWHSPSAGFVGHCGRFAIGSFTICRSGLNSNSLCLTFSNGRIAIPFFINLLHTNRHIIVFPA